MLCEIQGVMKPPFIMKPLELISLHFLENAFEVLLQTTPI